MKSRVSLNAHGVDAPKIRGFELSRNPREGLRILMEELRASPMSQMDFEAMFNIYDMLRYLDSYELEELMGEVDEFGNMQETMFLKMMLMNRWGAQDGVRAIEAALEDTNPMSKMMGMMGSMMGWMRKDPDSAYQWFQENKDKFTGGRMMGGADQFEAMYFAVKAKSDFEGTMERLDKMEDKTQRAVLEQLAQAFGSDAEKRDLLLERLEGDEVKLASTRESIVRNLAMGDPKEAWEFIKEQDLDEADRKKLENQLAQSWGWSDPEGALDWRVEQLEGEEGAGDEIAASFANWVRQDEAAASEWLRAQGDEVQTDQLFKEAGQRLQYDQPERAAEWHAQILDDEARHEAYRNFYPNWESQDEEAAQAWKASLPPEDQGFENRPEEPVEEADPAEAAAQGMVRESVQRALENEELTPEVREQLERMLEESSND